MVRLIVVLVAVGLLFMGLTMAITISAPYVALGVVILVLGLVFTKDDDDKKPPS